MLKRIGAARISEGDGKLHPTAAGLLMFGEEYKIRYEFPEYFLDYFVEKEVLPAFLSENEKAGRKKDDRLKADEIKKEKKQFYS